MKYIIYIFLFLLFSCNNSNSDTHKYDKNKNIEFCEKEAEKLFNDYEKLKEEYEDAKTYIQLLEQENEYLKKQRDSINNSLQN